MTITKAEIPKIISVDDHVIEPPDLWQRWLPTKYRDAGPKVVRSPYQLMPPLPGRPPAVMATQGPETDFWVYEDLVTVVSTAMASAGLAAEDIVEGPRAFDEMRPGAWQVKAR